MVPKGVFHDNVFGFTFGGPVRIPKVYNGKDKTFFFLNWEADRHRTIGFANLASVPTDLEKQGDFSQSLYNGRPAQIFDPAHRSVSERRVAAPALPAAKNSSKPLGPAVGRYQAYCPEPNTAP